MLGVAPDLGITDDMSVTVLEVGGVWMVEGVTGNCGVRYLADGW